MADTVRKVGYCYTKVSNRAGQGAKVLGALAEAGISIEAFSGFPTPGGVQLDFVVPDAAALRRVARREGLELSKVKRAFLVQGDDRAGAVRRHLDKLAAAKISVTAADAIADGKGRYGMLLWVKPKDYVRAAKALGAR